MKSKILKGYNFLAENYKPGDNIYIFGFSRGAHTARALAGLISYAGLPVKSKSDNELSSIEWKKLHQIVKKKNDVDYHDYWNTWTPDQTPPLAGEISKKLGFDFRPVQITLLGVWDTVPGSSLKKFGKCKEKPDRKDGDRYKSDSYPPIRNLVHAVSLDEKRNKFKPILLCPVKYPIDKTLQPKLIEEWFPGAHSDVGGGYNDGDNALPNISLNWMIEILTQHYQFETIPEKFSENPNGLAHWSVGDMEEVPGIKCQDRIVPANGQRHESADQRKGAPPIMIKAKYSIWDRMVAWYRDETLPVKVKKNYPYPITCADEKNLYKAP